MGEQGDRSFSLFGGIAYGVIMLFLLIFLLASSIFPNYQDVYYQNQLRHIPSLTLVRDGIAEEVDLPATIYDLKKDERIILSGDYLTQRHDSLLMKIEGAKLTLYINDNQAYSVKGETNTYPSFQKYPSPDIMLVALPNDDMVKHLRLEITVPEAKDKLELPAIYIGETSILFEQLAYENMSAFILASVLLLGGMLIVAFALLLLQRLDAAKSLIWLGVACFLAGLAGIGSNNIAIYLIAAPNLLYTIANIGLLLFSVPFLQYVKLMLDPIYIRLYRILQVLLGILVLVLLALHLLGIASFAQSQAFIHLSILIAVLVLNVFVFIELLVFENEQAKFHAIPAAILLVCTTVNSLDMFYLDIARDNLLLQLGILLFILWVTVLGWNNMRRLLAEAERSMQLELEVATMNRSLDMQRSLYQNLTQSTEEVRRVRHDLRHQLSAIRGYLQKGNVTGAIGYVEAISDGIPEIANKLLCDNFAVNAVAVYYLDKAIHAGIKTDIQLVVPENLGEVSNNDMSIMLGNLFENAIEGCLYVEKKKGFIRISCKVVKNRLTLAVDNSFDGNYKEHDGALYSRKRDGQGIGVSSVKAVVERYKGAMRIEATSDKFMVSLYVRM